MGWWSESGVKRLARSVIRRRKRQLLITSVAVLFALLPIAYSASNEPQKGPGEARAGDCGPLIYPEARQLRTQLSRFRLELLDLRTKYTEVHPRIRVVKTRIDEIRRTLKDYYSDSCDREEEVEERRAGLTPALSPWRYRAALR